MIDAIDPARLARIGLSSGLTQVLARLVIPEAAQLMRVTEVQRETIRVHDGDDEHAARALPALLQTLAAQQDALAVGDWVLALRDAYRQWWLHDRVPPLTQLARRHHDGRDKVWRTVLVSNVDTALLVMGLDADFNPRRLERYLALVRLAGVSAVVVLTKADLCVDAAEREARLREVEALLPAGTCALALDVLHDDAQAALAPWLTTGCTLVLIGSSGTGKSTLTNALLGSSVQQTGGTRSGDGRGRHTTTSRTLFTTAAGACIIDTPGLRTLRLDSEAGSIGAVFDDIAEHALHCRFRDCRHESEPGCAVRGAVAPERLRNYHKLLREARRDTLSALERKVQVSVWKQRSRAGRNAERAKRGLRP